MENNQPNTNTEPEVLPVTPNEIPIEPTPVAPEPAMEIPKPIEEFTEIPVQPEVTPVPEVAHTPIVEPVATESEPVIQAPVAPEQLASEPVIIQPYEEPKKGNKNILIGIITVLFLALAAGGGYMFMKHNSSEVIIAKSLTHLHGSFVNNTRFDFALPNIAEYLQSGKLSFKAESKDYNFQEIFNEINKFSADYKLEKRDASLYLDVDVKNSGNNFIDFQILAENNKIFLYGEKIFSKAVEFDFKTDYLLKDSYVTIDDYLYLYEFIIERTIRNLEKDDFVSNKTTITLNGEEKNVTATTLVLNQDIVHRLANSVLDDLKAEERANTILNKIFDDFSSFKFDKDDFSSDTTYKYSVYTTGLLSTVVGIDLTIIEDYSWSQWRVENGTAEVITTIEYRDEDLSTFYIESEDESFKVTLETNHNFYELKVYDSDNSEMLNITLKCEGTEQLNLDVNYNAFGLKLSMSYEVKLSNVVDGKEYKVSNLFKIDFNFEDVDATITINLDMEVKDISGTNVNPKFNRNQAVKMDGLSRADEEEISENFYRLIFEEFGLLDDY